MMNKLLSLSDCRQSGNSRFRLYNVRKVENVTSRGEKNDVFRQKRCFFGKLGRKMLKNRYLCTTLLLLSNRNIVNC